MILSLFISYSISNAADIEKAIIGKWQAQNGTIMEYLEDGTLLVRDSGRSYKILSDGRLKIEVSNPFLGRMIQVFNVSIEGNQLITVDQKGRADKFQRIK